LDAELALGELTSIDPVLAVDGIDELLMGFFGRSGGRLVADPPISLKVRSRDPVDAWSIRIEPEGRFRSRARPRGTACSRGERRTCMPCCGTAAMPAA
jgi:hypothetical protein